ncbi:hypothetical protein [Parafrankia sp. EUN1f]|uniref:hypothetical protein n=1 Tax=Parafrankia sp. EUN1f TaxID=102897 RepID=UPI0012F73060|nr:hypothetical protein [Parafrankia sp. EUN1f]
MLRLLVDADGIRSTSIRAVRGHAEARWPSWRPAELVTFVESQLAGLIHPPGGEDRTLTEVDFHQIVPTRLDLLAEVRPSSPAAGSPFGIWLVLHVDEMPSPHRSDQLEFRAVVRVSPLNKSMSYSDATSSSTQIGAGQDTPSPLRARGTVSGAATSIHLTDPGRPAGRYQVDAAVTVHIAGVRRPVGLAGIVPLHFDVFES